MADFDQVVQDQERTGVLINNIAALTRNPVADQYSHADVEARLDLLEAYWKTFVEQDFILQRSSTTRADSPYFKMNKFNEGLSLYLQAKAWFINRVRPPAPERSVASVTANAGVTSVTHSSQSSLEKVRLPRFNGRRRDWEAFKVKFSSLIVNDPTIAPIIKLQHLTNCLEGEALDRLRGIQQNAKNFTTAWETLCRRYDNSYLRFKAQMRILANIPAASEETEAHISQVLNIVNESINVFRVLKRPVDQWDDILVYFAENKLSAETRKDWAKEVERKELTEFPKFAQLKEFLEGRLDTLDVVDIENESMQVDSNTSSVSGEKSNKHGKKSHFQRKNKSTSVNVATQGKPQGKHTSKCSFCQGEHFLSYCQNFSRCSQEERKAHVAAAGLCFNCLKSGHRQGACTSKHRCFVCGENHHTKLHGIPNSGESSTTGSSASPEAAAAHAALNRSPCQQATGASGVLLATACVILQAPLGSRMTVRALLDSGAEESFISERVVQALGLETQPANVVVSGVGGNPTALSRNRVSAVLKSDCNPDFSLRFSALVLRRLTAALPRELTNLPPRPELQDLKLADPGLCLPKRIECILNSEVYAATLQSGLERGRSGSLVAMKSVFGWVLMGSPGNEAAREGGAANFHTIVDQTLTEAVSRFWEIEEVPRKHLLTPAEQDCYTYFKVTHRRGEDGRFVVRLPFVKPPVLNDTRLIAERCLARLERRLQREPRLAEAYTSFLDEYKNLEHLELVPDTEIDNRSAYYLPHHPVIKSDGSGKIRVVFNASQCDDAGHSLNTFLHTGPKLQEDVLIVIICWEFWRVVFTCDIIKMFRQYRVHAEDRDWQRILWRFIQGGPVQTARLSTVTYGTGCAPFIANACLLQLAEDEEERYPKGARALRKRRYVDDFFEGADELDETIQIKEDLIGILATAGMQVGKWASNRAELLPSSDEITAVNVLKEEADTVSTLGLCWMPSEDFFVLRSKQLPPVRL